MNEAAVRERLIAYLTGQISLRDLDAALSPLGWDPASDVAMRDLVNTIELRVDEYSSGTCDENELRAALRPLVTGYTTAMLFGPVDSVQVQSGSSSNFVPSSLTVTPTVFGRSLEAVPS